ncbi:type II secretion system protein [Notoacmeibacter marinus]|uniref:Type II secretion system protein n=1 Tax=Notoacmeibacter marinus TaxID=1876515 RepID=A0A231V0R9_9HYPH|nr:type II secretion system F family protein [Notoacmeibacter marinus]OXT01805.1 type II secretion system protein [Notoacmeibacter marinus]
MLNFDDLLDPTFLFSLLTALAVFATLFALLPQLGADPMKKRMKTMALEREELRAQQRARLAVESSERRSVGLRETQNTKMTRIVDKLDLRAALVDDATMKMIRAAGYRGQAPVTRFLFFRLVLPFGFLAASALYIFGFGLLKDQTLMVRIAVMLGVTYFGFYLPVLFMKNKAQKRADSIRKAWPDALDLLLICVESGISIEAAFRRVAEEIGAQSLELAEELMLTTAELSYLEDRRTAYDNLATRTQLEPVKSVCQALIQSERYGTPIGQALRVLAKESRDHRMNEAEKKAAALPPKLTVPMILFFLPVLFIVILTPAGMEISRNM